MTLLRDGSTATPSLFLVSPIHGDSRSYRQLADALSSAARVYGVDAVGLFDGLAPYEHLEQMSLRCVELIEELEPAGPVRLGGSSIGAVVAADAAEQLAQSNRDVACVMIIDARAPHAGMKRRPTDPVSCAGFYIRSAVLTKEAEVPDVSLERGTADEVAETLERIGVPPLVHDVPLEIQLEVFRANIRAYFHHQQRALSTRVVLVEAESEHPQHPRPPTLGWEAFAARLERRKTAGTHYTCLLPPNVRTLAALVDEEIMTGEPAA